MLRPRPRVLDPGPELRNLTTPAKAAQIPFPVFATSSLNHINYFETLFVLHDLAFLLAKDAMQFGTDNPLRYEWRDTPLTVEVILSSNDQPWLLLDTVPHDRYDS